MGPCVSKSKEPRAQNRPLDKEKQASTPSNNNAKPAAPKAGVVKEEIKKEESPASELSPEQESTKGEQHIESKEQTNKISDGNTRSEAIQQDPVTENATENISNDAVGSSKEPLEHESTVVNKINANDNANDENNDTRLNNNNENSSNNDNYSNNNNDNNKELKPVSQASETLTQDQKDPDLIDNGNSKVDNMTHSEESHVPKEEGLNQIEESATEANQHSHIVKSAYISTETTVVSKESRSISESAKFVEQVESSTESNRLGQPLTETSDHVHVVKATHESTETTIMSEESRSVDKSAQVIDQIAPLIESSEDVNAEKTTDDQLEKTVDTSQQPRPSGESNEEKEKVSKENEKATDDFIETIVDSQEPKCVGEPVENAEPSDSGGFKVEESMLAGDLSNHLSTEGSRKEIDDKAIASGTPVPGLDGDLVKTNEDEPVLIESYSIDGNKAVEVHQAEEGKSSESTAVAAAIGAGAILIATAGASTAGVTTHDTPIANGTESISPADISQQSRSLDKSVEVNERVGSSIEPSEGEEKMLEASEKSNDDSEATTTETTSEQPSDLVKTNADLPVISSYSIDGNKAIATHQDEEAEKPSNSTAVAAAIGAGAIAIATAGTSAAVATNDAPDANGTEVTANAITQETTAESEKSNTQNANDELTDSEVSTIEKISVVRYASTAMISSVPVTHGILNLGPIVIRSGIKTCTDALKQEDKAKALNDFTIGHRDLMTYLTIYDQLEDGVEGVAPGLFALLNIKFDGIAEKTGLGSTHEHMSIMESVLEETIATKDLEQINMVWETFILQNEKRLKDEQQLMEPLLDDLLKINHPELMNLLQEYVMPCATADKNFPFYLSYAMKNHELNGNEDHLLTQIETYRKIATDEQWAEWTPHIKAGLSDEMTSTLSSRLDFKF